MRTSTRTSQGLLTCAHRRSPKSFRVYDLSMAPAPNRMQHYAYCCASKGGMPEFSPNRNPVETIAGRSPRSSPALVTPWFPLESNDASPISTASYRCQPLTRLTAAPRTGTIDASLNGSGGCRANPTRTGCSIPTPDAPLDSGDLAGVPF